MNKNEIRAEQIEQAMKQFKEPVKLKDLVKATEDHVSWSLNPTGDMTSAMKLRNEIQKVGFGLYQHIPQQKTEKVEEGQMKDSDKKLLEDFNKVNEANRKVEPVRVYKSGDKFEGVVSGIEGYGVFVVDEFDTTGLIHYSNIKKGKLSPDPKHFFKVGDRVQAKVMTIRKGNKIALSTFDSDLPDYFKEEEESNPFSVLRSVGISADKERPADKLAVRKAVVTQTKEDKEMMKFIQDKVGVISEEGQKKIEALVEQHGLFKVAMSLADMREWKADLSLLFAEELGNKMSECL